MTPPLRVTDVRIAPYLEDDHRMVVVTFEARGRRGFFRMTHTTFESALYHIRSDLKRQVFSDRFGLGDHGPLAGVAPTYDHLGKLYGVSRARVHQIVDEASAEFVAALTGQRDVTAQRIDEPQRRR